jgi:pyrroloquinoline quinone biosynthesis protein E
MYKTKPFFIELELTYGCSQQCFYCHNPPKERKFFIADNHPYPRSVTEIEELSLKE